MATKDKDTTIKKSTTNRKTDTHRKTTKSKHAEEEPITNGEIIKWTSGALLFFMAILLLIAFTSTFFTGAEDQKYINGNIDHASNWLGSTGAWLVSNVMNRSFGISSFLIPIFMIASALRILEIGHIRLWKWFLNCTIIVVWFSVALDYVQHYFLKDHFLKIGGEHGRTIFNYVTERIGEPGLFIALALSLLAYIGYLSGETVRTIRRTLEAARKKAEQIAAEKEARKAAKEENNDVDEETDVEIINTNSLEEDINNAEHLDESSGTFDEMLQNNSENNAEHSGNRATTIDFTPNVPVEEIVETDTPFEIETNGRPVSDGSSDPEDVNAPKVTIGEAEPEADLTASGALEPYDPKLDLEHYQYPKLDLLKKYELDAQPIDMEEQKKNKDQIIKVLSYFGVEISSIKATVGPTITLYEITPAPGVRISKIRNLEDDIALSLSALGIRIIAPIPGKGTIGIEVPNAKPQMVSMESIINSKKFQETEFELPMALGKTITNEIYMVDLAKMPHLLVAGATGQGKSVGLNAIITSLLYKKHPAELKLVMVDPKKVEFSVYNPIVNHFLAQVEGNEDTDEPIITDVNKVVQTLKSLCQEMDTRYDLLKKARARNVKEYNAKFKERHLNPEHGHKFMPYIVVIIDEFGDLIMTAGKEIELPIARIAQLARAVGIHMIIATQRPTTNIITGTIKANFPARMAFKVSAMIDSRTILDRPGANQLVGKGDMLFLAGTEPVRVQCAFVDTPEVERICNHIACQQSYNMPFPLPAVAMEGEGGDGPDVDMNHLDPMFEEVARLIVSTQQGSTSMIQRKFSIGYNRAGRLMDQMEKAGIVGPAQGSKPREVLVMGDIELDQLLCGLR